LKLANGKNGRLERARKAGKIGKIGKLGDYYYLCGIIYIIGNTD